MIYEDSIFIKQPLGKSDHSVISCNLNLYVENNDEQFVRQQYFKGDYDHIKSELNKVGWDDLLSDKGVNEAWNSLKSVIEELSSKYIPERKMKMNGNKRNSPLQLDNLTRRAVIKKSKYWKKYKYSRSQNNYTKYAEARQTCANQVKEAKRSYERKIAFEVKSNNKSFWRYVNSKRKTRESIGVLNRSDNSEAKSDIDKAEVLNSFFSSVFIRSDMDATEQLHHTRSVSQELDEFTVSTEHVLKALSSLSLYIDPTIQVSRCAELSHALSEYVNIDNLKTLLNTQEDEQFLSEYDSFTLATSYFDLKDYDRAAHFLKECKHPRCYFLYMYSRYMADEKRKLDRQPDSTGPTNYTDNEHLKTLRIELSQKYANKELDGYTMYLYGVVLKKLDLMKDALEVLVEAIHLEPMHWGAWQELVPLINDREMLISLSLCDRWIKQFFLALGFLELQMNDEALKIFGDLEENGFHKSTYVLAHIAVAYHNMRVVDPAVNTFNELQKLDPYRLENMDTYSNLLYIKEMRYELAHLAHKCCDIDKYRVETCCVIGNYYSLRNQHEKAALYFQRSIKLNPLYLSAWTLMGHEFMELKNTNAAIQAYRQALEVNKRDYRAWYGLGQTYEILKMPNYCLYYYRNAQRLRPNDSRMVMALGESFEKLDRIPEAIKCFWKAHRIGDIEGECLLRIAKLYVRLEEEEQAAGAYSEFLNLAFVQGNYSDEGQSEAYKYLANYYLKRGQLDQAYNAAQRCSTYTETREEAKAILKQIQQMRQEKSPKHEIRMDDSYGSITNMGNDSFQSNSNTPLFPHVMSLRFNTP